MRDNKTLCVLALLAWVALGARAETNETVELALWSDPEFLRQFLGTYGVRSEIEPRVTPDERLEFEQFSKLMVTPVGADKALALLEKSVAKAVDKKGISRSSALYDFTIGSI